VVYLEFYMYWSSLAFKAKSEKKIINRGKDLKHRYSADGHVCKSQRLVRLYGSSAIYMYVVMRLNFNYRPSVMVSFQLTSRSS
jgi:hypothetical protein